MKSCNPSSSPTAASNSRNKCSGIHQAVGWDHHDSPTHNLAATSSKASNMAEVVKAAAPPGPNSYLGVLADAGEDSITPHPVTQAQAHRLADLVRDHSHYFSRARSITASRSWVDNSCRPGSPILPCGSTRWACVLSSSIPIFGRIDGCMFERDKAAADLFHGHGGAAIQPMFHELFDNDDESMRAAAKGGNAVQRYAAQRSVCDSPIVPHRSRHRQTAQAGRNRAIPRQ